MSEAVYEYIGKLCSRVFSGKQTLQFAPIVTNRPMMSQLSYFHLGCFSQRSKLLYANKDVTLDQYIPFGYLSYLKTVILGALLSTKEVFKHEDAL